MASPSVAVDQPRAPQAAAVAKPKAKAKGKLEKTLMQQIEQEEKDSTPTKGASNPKRGLDQTVDNILKDHFKGLSSRQVDVVTRDGATLREVLTRDKQLQQQGKLAMG